MDSGGERGQATIEHLGLVMVIAVVLLAAAGVASVGAAGVLNRVVAGINRSLCVVAGQRCTQSASEPCPVLRTTEASSQGLELSLLRVAHDRALFVERRSDGTYAMSLVEGLKGGVGLAGQAGPFGAAELEASILAGHRGGRTYLAKDGAQARALVAHLRGQRLPELRSVVAGIGDLTGLSRSEPSVAAYVVSGELAVDALGRLGLGGLFGVDGEGTTAGELGVKIAAHEQAVTVVAQLDARAGAFFNALSEVRTSGSRPGTARPRRRSASRGGRGGRDQTAKPTESTDRSGARARPGSADRPIEGSVTNPLPLEWSGEAVGGGSVALRFGPGPRLEQVEIIGYAGLGSTRHELRARLDPADPAVAAAVESWRAAPQQLGRLRDLGQVAADRAELDQRTFATTSSRTDGGARIARGRGVGVTYARARLTSRLLSQRSRPSGGVWEERVDCEPVVAGLRPVRPVRPARRRATDQRLPASAGAGLPWRQRRPHSSV